MHEPIIGANVDDLRMSIKKGIPFIAQHAFRAVELPGVSEEVARGPLNESGRRHIARFVRSHGLQLGSLTADVAGTRFTDSATVQERVDKTCQILSLSRDLGTNVVTASIPSLVDPTTDEPSELALEALRRVGEQADRTGAFYAIRPAFDSPETIANVLSQVGCDSLRIALDPAVLVMTGNDPYKMLEQHAERIVLSHLRDARAGGSERVGEETAIGEGDVNLMGILAILGAAQYGGVHILRHTNSNTPREDIARGFDTIKDILPP